MIVVSDASPIIGLGAIGKLDLLRELYGTILVPTAVWDEVTAVDPSVPGVAEFSSADWIRVTEVSESRLVAALAHEIDRGEGEAIALAAQHDADLLLLDERRARRVANRLGQPVIGVLGILVAAKRRGLLSEVRPALDQLVQEAGFRISQALRSRVLDVAGESG